MLTWKIPLAVLSILLVLPAAIPAQDLGSVPTPENLSVDVRVELRRDGRCAIEAAGSALTEPFSENLTDFPLTSANLNAEISSPSPSVLRLTLSAKLRLTEVPSELSALSKEGINALLSMSGIVGSSLGELLGQMGGEEQPKIPPELYQIVVSKLECTKFSLSGSELNVGFLAELSGQIPENMREGLPLEMDVAASIGQSILEIRAEVDGRTDSLEMTVRAHPPTGAVEFQISAVFDLPKENGRVRWFFSLPPEYSLVSEELENFLFSSSISFTLTVPENASLGGLPPGYVQENANSFTWSGEVASDALLSILSGQVSPSVSYTPAQPSRTGLSAAAIAAVIIVAVIAAAAIVLRKR